MQQEDSRHQGFRILVVVSRPLDLDDLPNLADQWALQSGLKRVQAPTFLKMLHPPTVEGLRSEILSGYDIVHFDGHGALGRRCPNCGALHLPEEKKCDRCAALLEDEEPKGYFAFEREDGLTDALSAEELAEIVASTPEPVKLVFLSACQSAKGGDASLQNVLLARGVPAVLGMNESVPLKATMALARPFYAGLGAGMTIIRAFENAMPALKKLENGGNLQKIPVLEGPGKDARILPARVTGRASFEAERLFGLPEHEFLGGYIRDDPPRGRKGLLSQVMDALQSGEKLVILTGQGGIGKTVLAAEAARRLAWLYPGGVFWRSAADMERLGLEETLNAFDNVFGIQFRTLPLDRKKDMVLNYLRNFDTASLLVVDNAESIKDSGFWRFLEGIPQPSAALLTTRESPPCGGREIRVPEMEREEAISLFLREARRSFPKWGERLSEEELSSLAEIAGFMQGHPLAIKLVAGQSTRRSLAGIRDELRRNPPKGVSERFDVSYNGLEEGQKDLFSRLAVFFGSMDENAIRSVCLEDDQEGHSNWESDLEELVRCSFLDRVEIAALDKKGNEVTLYRYRLHPLMRQYAACKAGDDLLARLRPRAAKHFLEYARHFKDNFDMLEWERENILAGMDWAAGLQNSFSGESKMDAASLVLKFMSALNRYLDMSGYWSEYNLRLQQAIKAAETINDQKQISGWGQNLGVNFQRMGKYDEARELHKKSLAISRELGDNSGIVSSLLNLGMLAQAIGDYDEARELYQQSMAISQDVGNKSGMCKSLHVLGNLAQATGELDEARKFYQQSIKILRELGNERDNSKLFHNMGTLAQSAGELDETRKLYQQSLAISRKLGDQYGMSRVLHQMGTLAQATGELDEARKLYQQSMKILQDLGDRKGVASSLHNLGMLAQVRGYQDEACKLYLQSLAISLELGDKVGESRSLHQMSMMAQTTGDHEKAINLCQQSLEIKKELGDKGGVSRSLHQLGMLAQAKGNHHEAFKLYQQSLAISRELGDKSGMSRSLHQLGTLAQAAGDHHEACKLFQESLAIAHDISDKSGVASSLHQMGMLAQATGEYDEARKLYQQSLKIVQELGDKSGIAFTKAQLALLEEQMGNKKEALQLIVQAEAAFLELGSPYAEQAGKDRQRLEQDQ
ncbi:MAG TPA: tetratricopeptide repeat protein [Methanothrix sp.]|nr:tetratricopeptide repeat protein [Methanothrix sp.]